MRCQRIVRELSENTALGSLKLRFLSVKPLEERGIKKNAARTFFRGFVCARKKKTYPP